MAIKISQRATLLGVAFLLSLSPLGAAQAGDWFQHRFGEARAYFGDWLAVCANKGQGDCRAVHLRAKEDAPGGGYRRISIAVPAPGDYRITLTHRGMPTPPPEPIQLLVDGEEYRLEPGTYVPGEVDVPNLAETVTVTDAVVNGALVGALKPAGRLTLLYPAGGGNRQAEFSLRGLTATLNAIEARLNAR